MKPTLIIITQEQFGYFIDAYYYCRYLKKHYNIVYICWDHGFEKLKMEAIKITYIPRKGNFIIRSYFFLRAVLKEIAQSKNRPIVFIKYFKILASFLRLFSLGHLSVLDIRTGNVMPERHKRLIMDWLMKIETIFFNHITIISEGLAKKMGLSHKANILPLGADILSKKNKTFDRIDLLYVGTLYNRNVEQTIYGFDQFYNEFSESLPISYTIIGGGHADEEHQLRKLIHRLNLGHVIHVMGRIPHDKLKPYFDQSNIGVSYIPITDYFDNQPPTKTFEYLLSGMPVIATRTSENKKIIHPGNGVLIKDGINEFYLGLTTLNKSLKNFESDQIRDAAKDHTWENIILNNLKPYLKELTLHNHQIK